MTKALLRQAASIALGVLFAAMFLGVAHIAGAQGIDLTDPDALLDSEFSDATGLGDADLKTTIGNIINVVLGFLGVIAVVIVLFGGFKWMTAGGNDEKVQEAKKLLIAGVIGLAIIFSAYAITSFVLTSLVSASQG